MACSIGRSAITAASKKFRFEDAVEEFFSEFPERRADTQIFDVALGEDALTRAAFERLSRLPNGFLPGKMIRDLLRDRGPSVAHFYRDEGEREFRERDVEDYGPPPLSVMFAPGRAPRGGSFAESVLKDYFLAKSSQAVFYRERDILTIPDEPAFTSDEYWLWHVFDHEAAHVLFAHEKTARAFSARGPNFEECVSDVYSLIRHYQRFGADTGFDRALTLSRARLIPDMRTKYACSHMTVAALEAVMALDRGSLLNLKPRQVFELALRTVDKSALSRKLLDEFADASVATMSLQPVEVVRHYAGSGLPAPLVGDFIAASRAFQKHEGLALIAIAAAQSNRPIILIP